MEMIPEIKAGQEYLNFNLAEPLHMPIDGHQPALDPANPNFFRHSHSKS